MFDVTAENLSKTYKNARSKALNEISFQVPKGELFGLIGPDGAGKTSLFRILTTLLLPDSGSATVNGSHIIRDYKDIRKKVGYMPGRFSLYQDLTVEENLNFFATIFNTTLQANYNLIKDIYEHIEPFKTRKAGNLSGGMKQKLALCCALIHRPVVLFLDEPTTGVDTVSRKEFWIILKKLKEEGITIMVSTPYMDEASLCERIALIQDGEIMSINSPKAIINEYPDTLYAIKSDKMSHLLSDLRDSNSIKSVHSFGEYHHISFQTKREKTSTDLKHFIQTLDHSNIECRQIAPTVEDCFIHLMSQKKSHA